MKVVTDIRNSTPVMAVVGVTDLAVGALRTAQADLNARAGKAQSKAAARAEAIRAELTPAKLQAEVASLPTLAISKSLAVAGKAEETYTELSSRGRVLVTKVRRRPATKDLFAQGKSTLTLGKAAVTTVRKASDETLVAAKATLTAGRREAAGLVGSVVRDAGTEAKAAKPAAKKAAKKATKNTRAASKRTATTARTRTATAKKATKATATSARKTATKAAEATASAAEVIGS